MRILIVDDEVDVFNSLSAAIQEKLGCVPDHEPDFDRAPERVRALRPDVLILDLRKTAGTDPTPGQKTWRGVWTEGRFCPTIIYSALETDLLPPVPEGHPFVKRVKKGIGTPQIVVGELESFVPKVKALGDLHEEIDSAIQNALRETAGAGLLPGDEPSHLVHVARRRVAAQMDEATLISKRSLFSWEQYLVPAIGTSPLTADVIRERAKDSTDASAFRVVLSPSCDLVGDREHLDTILVARCEALDNLMRRFSCPVKPAEADTAMKRISDQILNQGSYAGLLVLPEFKNRIPNMVANMKALEVLRYRQIGAEDGGRSKFVRIASIDSPYRERIAWTFLSTVARPGVPAVDTKDWASALLDARRRVVEEEKRKEAEKAAAAPKKQTKAGAKPRGGDAPSRSAAPAPAPVQEADEQAAKEKQKKRKKR